MGTVSAAPMQSVGQTGRSAPSSPSTPAQFASQAADRTLGPSTPVQASTPAAAPASSPVLDWAQRQEGQRVGSGECFDLADQALRQNGMKTASDYGRVTPDADYRWGQAVPLNQSQPGDILQFRNYENSTTQADGSGYDRDRPHHTAVVVGNDGHGNITVLEQNAEPPESPVTRRVLHFGNGQVQDENGNPTTQHTTGTTRAYRPQPRG
ncbi:MAG: CHAP domain-containing protein [Candidatus Eremiobacteraeota bacterium]|nr:CHAP domain-containing protein [Candidatus Eremiobacteraeota bacterium]